MMKVYIALYNYCIYEGSPTPISVHSTLEGAQEAIYKHRSNEYDKWDKMRDDEEKKEMPFGEDEWWGIRDFELMK